MASGASSVNLENNVNKINSRNSFYKSVRRPRDVAYTFNTNGEIFNKRNNLDQQELHSRSICFIICRVRTRNSGWRGTVGYVL